jgi:hypothetical protein
MLLGSCADRHDRGKIHRPEPLYVFAPPPTSRIPSTMEHGVDENLGPSNLEKYGVREPTEKSSTHRAVHELVGFGMLSNRREASVDSS